MIQAKIGYGGKTISSGAELIDYYTWLVSVVCNIENRNERAQEVLKVRKLIESKLVDIHSESV